MEVKPPHRSFVSRTTLIIHDNLFFTYSMWTRIKFQEIPSSVLCSLITLDLHAMMTFIYHFISVPTSA